MTYRKLLEILSKQPGEILDKQDVTMYDPFLDEYFPIKAIEISNSKDDRLDPGHLYLEAE